MESELPIPSLTSTLSQIRRQIQGLHLRFPKRFPIPFPDGQRHGLTVTSTSTYRRFDPGGLLVGLSFLPVFVEKEGLYTKCLPRI